LTRTVGKVLRSPLLPGTLLVLTLLAAAPGMAHAEPSGGWGWWLPPNHSVHGDAIDVIFNWIFWITTIVMILVEVTMVIFCIKYRDQGKRPKATFIHGNTRLEMVWTVIPAVIFAIIALYSKKVWDSYRYAEVQEDHAEILVVGEQFKWNVVYPGPDGKLGDYLVFPQPTDTAITDVDGTKRPDFRKFPYEEALKKINNYILQNNPLGQDPTGPNAQYAKDDDYDHQPGRAVIIPCGKQVRVWISSKDVIHDFYLPNFRVKLDAVPGMKGHVDFTAKPDSQSTKTLPIDDAGLLDKVAWVSPSTTKGAVYDKQLKNYFLPDPKTKKALVHSLKDRIDANMIKACKAAGITELTAVVKPYEVVCEELCGQGHTTMKAEFYVVSQEEYQDFVTKGAAPTTKPSNLALAQ
jgi:heme/copper-type cytochrome/quinol oxidase subunit 2